MNFDLTKTLEKEKELFEPLDVPEFESSDDAYNELARAEAAYFRYMKMKPLIKQLNDTIEDLEIKSPEWDLMTEDDHNDALEHCTIDAIGIMKDHIENQLKVFKKYCEDLEATAEDIAAEERDVRKYGSYADQVRSYFYSTR